MIILSEDSILCTDWTVVQQIGHQNLTDCSLKFQQIVRLSLVKIRLEVQVYMYSGCQMHRYTQTPCLHAGTGIKQAHSQAPSARSIPPDAHVPNRSWPTITPRHWFGWLKSAKLSCSQRWKPCNGFLHYTHASTHQGHHASCKLSTKFVLEPQ